MNFQRMILDISQKFNSIVLKWQTFYLVHSELIVIPYIGQRGCLCVAISRQRRLWHFGCLQATGNHTTACHRLTTLSQRNKDTGNTIHEITLFWYAVNIISIFIHPPDLSLYLIFPWTKMAAISQTIFSYAFSWMKTFVFLIKISLKFVLKGPIDNNPALV